VILAPPTVTAFRIHTGLESVPKARDSSLRRALPL
jgi:hypothetical protein